MVLGLYISLYDYYEKIITNVDSRSIYNATLQLLVGPVCEL